MLTNPNSIKKSIQNTRIASNPTTRQGLGHAHGLGDGPGKKKSQRAITASPTFIQMAINQQTITLLGRTSSTQWQQTTINQLHCPETEYSSSKKQ
jgi:hypothetical protein